MPARPHGVRQQDWFAQQSFVSQAKTYRRDFQALRDVLREVGLPVLIEIPILIRHVNGGWWNPPWRVEEQELQHLLNAQKVLANRPAKTELEREALRWVQMELEARGVKAVAT
jgi:hypothetical protein